jgi:hypothetical protein
MEDSATPNPSSREQARPAPGRRVAGRVVLALILAALAIYAVVTLGVGANLDDDLARKQAQPAREDAGQWMAAWRENKPRVETTAMKEEAAAAIAQWKQAEDAWHAKQWDDARSSYRDAAEGLSRTFELQVAGALDELNGALTVWHHELRDRFPFNPDSLENAPLAAVERLFNPLNGRYWLAASELDRLASIEVGDVRIAPPPKSLTTSRPMMTWLAMALFEGRASRHVSFSMRILDGGPWRADFSLGETTVPADGREFLPLVWQRQPARMQFSGDGDRGGEATDWSLLRLLWQFERSPRDGDLLAWRYTGSTDTHAGAHEPMVIEIRPASPTHPFEPDAFRALQIE